jgi:hypothetical protein
MRILIALIVLLMFTSCDQVDEKVVIIGPNQVPCMQGSPEACYLIKESSSDPWQVMDSTIEALEPDDGYQYTVLVRERDRVSDDPYIVPKVTFLVVDVIEKREVMGRIKWYYG